MDGKNRLHRFQLDDDGIFDEQIQAVPAFQQQVLIANRNDDLRSHGQVARFKFINACAIRAFYKAWTDSSMDFDRGLNDQEGETVEGGCIHARVDGNYQAAGVQSLFEAILSRRLSDRQYRHVIGMGEVRFLRPAVHDHPATP